MIILFVLLVALFCLTAINSAFRRLQKKDSKKQLDALGKLFFYRYIHTSLFPRHDYEGLFFANTCAQNALRFGYALASFFLLSKLGLLLYSDQSPLMMEWPGALSLVAIFLIFFIFGDYLPRIFGIRYPEMAIKLGAFIASCCLFLILPFTFIFLKLSQVFNKAIYFDQLEPFEQAKQEIIDMIEESDVISQLDLHDKKLIESVVSFKDRIAREVMVPRVDVFSLPAETTIQEAASVLLNEGYSRTPVYKNTLDNITGVLMYKDILSKYMEYEQKGDIKIIQAPIATLVKNVLYTPETKKISHLLQEFRKKQVHLAIVVDEYGGTEGIVTIEDILEEIVGDIADEYDEEEALFISLPEGGWIIDARMSILDIEEQLNIEIPQDGDYDTIGGYIFHETGMIPAKGFKIKQPNFELEVLRSNDRCVEKIRIQALQASDTQETRTGS
jgi:putative hemolysin